jgi:hypothetical protein
MKADSEIFSGDQEFVASDEGVPIERVATPEAKSAERAWRVAQRFGRDILATTAAVTAIGCSQEKGPAMSPMEIPGEVADRFRWEELQSRAPEIEPPPVETLAEATPAQREKVFKVRDKSFRLALDEGIQTYKQQARTPSEMAHLDSLVAADYKDHSVAQADKILEQQGLPIRVDRPYPVIRFIESDSTSGVAVERSMEKDNAAGRYDRPFASPDTIYVNVKKGTLPFEHILHHEETHWRLSDFFKDPNIKIEDQQQFRALNEGLTELCTQVILRAEGSKNARATYGQGVLAADLLGRRLGGDNFWNLLKTGGVDAILAEAQKRYGAENVKLLLDHDGFESQLASPEITERYDAYKRLRESGLLDVQDLKNVENHFGIPFYNVEKQTLKDFDGQLIGMIDFAPDSLHMVVDLPDGARGRYTILPDQISGTMDGKQPAPEFPRALEIYKDFINPQVAGQPDRTEKVFKEFNQRMSAAVALRFPTTAK